MPRVHPEFCVNAPYSLRDASYHCLGGQDGVERLDFGFIVRVVAATVGAAGETVGLVR